MPLRVHNTLTRAIEPFTPAEPGKVRMYVCGPSVYDYSHIGHARSYVAYDAMKRYFLSQGMKVRHVQNFTDVEEQIAERARAAGLAPLELADRLITAFFEDMDPLRILRADAYPRVSEHIPEIQAILRNLVDRRIAYPVDCHQGKRQGRESYVCDVYFDVTKAPSFGALIGQGLDDLAVDAPREKGERRHPLDFALWKSHDDWGVTWPSPWGDGRPGWHVECTAMSLKHLGAGFDLHGGGLDLIYPHHESEKTVGEAHTGTPYCNYFLHNGFVTIDRQKMSKSKHNFVLVRDLLTRHDPEAIRAFLLSAHYREPLNYDEAAIEAAGKRVAGWRADVRKLQRRASGAEATTPLPPSLRKEREAFIAAIEDDFRYGAALDAIDRAIETSRTLHAEAATAALEFLKEAANVTGLLWDLETWSADEAKR